MTKFSDLKNFKSVYKRNFVIGTESTKSNSYMNLILILTVYGLNPVSFESVDENIEYNDNDVFILNESKANLYTMYKNKKLDGIFVSDIQTN